MRYPGPWDSDARRSGRSGPLAPPGAYTVRLAANGVTVTQRLVLNPDPRVVRDGVSPEIMREQLAHNLRVRDLVSDANRAAADLARARQKAGATDGDTALARRVDVLERILLTPPVRYSRPGLQSQIQYLYGAAVTADQKVGRDAVLRYEELRQELGALLPQIAALLRATP